MNEVPETLPQQDTVPRSTKVLCVCDNGHSRSKYMARALGEIGYSNARVLGIRDPKVDNKDKLAALTASDMILCATSTTQSEVKRFLGRMGVSPDAGDFQILSLEIPETLHSKLYMRLKGILKNPSQDNSELISQLNKLGFK